MDSDRQKELTDLLVKRVEAYGVLANTGSGKLIMEDLEMVCHGARTTFVVGDPNYTLFNEGKRWVWLYIQTRLKAAGSPAQLAAQIESMLEEYEEEEF